MTALVAGARQGEDPSGAEAEGRQNGTGEARATPEADAVTRAAGQTPDTTGTEESELVGRLRAWGENDPDPSYFNGDVLTGVLLDCGEASTALTSLRQEVDLWKATAAQEAEAYEEQRADALRYREQSKLNWRSFKAEREAKEATTARLTEALGRVGALEEALRRIAGSRLGDMNTLHPDACAHVAREALSQGASDDA